MKGVSTYDVIRSLKKLNYSVYEHDSKPYNLNIVGIRATNPVVNDFNDLMCVFWKFKGNWNAYKMICTTLPGLKYLETPLNPAGCAILVPGQYKSTYSVDKHNGKYDALCQRLADVTVYRDDDKDNDYDMIDVSEQTGMFGINIHQADDEFSIDHVNGYSAGCQVIQNPKEYDIHMDVVKMAAEVWGNSFTYTLINEKDLL